MFATRICGTLLLLSSALLLVQAADHPAPGPDKSTASANKSGVKNIDVREFEKLRTAKTNVILDVRTPQEFAAGHMPGAVNIDVNSPEFDKKVATLDPKKTYLVHCAAGFRGSKACEKLQKLSFGRVYNLEGGMKAWEKAGQKAEK